MNSLRFCLFVNCVISDAQVIGCVVSQTTHPDDPIGAKGLSEEPLCASCPKMGQGGRREGGRRGRGDLTEITMELNEIFAEFGNLSASVGIHCGEKTWLWLYVQQPDEQGNCIGFFTNLSCHAVAAGRDS